jgi:hypothetical protein
VQPKPDALSLSQVEAISYGKTTSDQLRVLLGEPDQILRHQAITGEVWRYQTAQTGIGSADRANFSINTEGKVTGVLWFPRSGEPVESLSGFLAHYSRLRFSSREEVRENGDSIDREYIYESSDGSINATVHYVHKSVTMVRFGEPKKRSLSSKERL